MTAWLVDGRGRPITIRDVMLHHVVFHRVAGPRGGYAVHEPGGEAIYGTGEEKQNLRLPRGYGYRVRRGDRWRITAMLMSHSLRHVRRVRPIPRHGRDRPARSSPCAPFWVRASGCGAQVSYPVRRRRRARLGPTRQGVRLEGAVQRPHRRRRRPPARRREGHVALAAALRRPPAARHRAALRDARPPLLPRPADPARARPGRHPLLPLPHRHPGPQGGDDAPHAGPTSPSARTRA